MDEARHTFGPFVLTPGRELRRDGKPVPIGHRALLMLETMLEARGEIVTKPEMMARVWPGVIVEEGNIAVQIAALRKELGARPGATRKRDPAQATLTRSAGTSVNLPSRWSRSNGFIM